MRGQTHCTATRCKTCSATARSDCGTQLHIVSSLRVRVNERQTHRTATRSSNAGNEDKPPLGRYGHSWLLLATARRSWLQLATAGKIFPSWLRCADGEADGCMGALRLCSAQNKIRSPAPTAATAVTIDMLKLLTLVSIR